MFYCVVFALFSFEFEGNFRVQAPGGLWRDDLSEGFFALRFCRAYIWSDG